jgi:hypothetical protein
MSRAGILIVTLALGGCESAPGTGSRSLVDQGYLLGSADTIKQLYWAKQALEAPREARPAGRTEYYVWDDPGIAGDGRKLAPAPVAVPVFVPAPAPAQARNP